MNASSRIPAGLVAEVKGVNGGGYFYPLNKTNGYFEITRRQIMNVFRKSVELGDIIIDAKYIKDSNETVEITTLMDSDNIKKLGIIFTGEEETLNSEITFINDEETKTIKFIHKAAAIKLASFKVGEDKFIVIRGVDFIGAFKTAYGDKLNLDIVFEKQTEEDVEINTNIKLKAFGTDAGNNEFVLLEEKIGREYITYPVYVRLGDPYLVIASGMEKKDKIRESSKFKRKLLKAYRKHTFGEGKAQIKTLCKRGNVKLYVSANKAEKDENSLINLTEPEVIMGKKVVKGTIIASLIFANKTQIFKTEDKEHLEMTLAHGFKTYIFQPPKGWKINKVTELGS